MLHDAFDPTYSHDTEFHKLLERRDDVDLVSAALELSRDADRTLDFAATRLWVERQAEEITAESPGASPEHCLRALCAFLGERVGLRGDADAYHTAESSYLSRVIETRRGIPISLSLLYVAVGRRLGLEMNGVSAPAHFLAGCETPSGRVYVDAFNAGRLLTKSDAVAMLRAMTGLSAERIRRSLSPAAPRAIVIRMLNNLKRLFVAREAWFPAFRVQHRLSHLQPGDYCERRDLAVLSYRAGRLSEGVDLLKRCLRTCPDVEKPALREHLRNARSGLAGWN